MRIYVAGRYSDDNILGCLSNIRRGIKICARLVKAGHTPYCPWLDFLFHFFEEDLVEEDYYNYGLRWLEVCEEVWVLPNSEIL